MSAESHPMLEPASEEALHGMAQLIVRTVEQAERRSLAYVTEAGIAIDLTTEYNIVATDLPAAAGVQTITRLENVQALAGAIDGDLNRFPGSTPRGLRGAASLIARAVLDPAAILPVARVDYTYIGLRRPSQVLHAGVFYTSEGTEGMHAGLDTPKNAAADTRLANLIVEMWTTRVQEFRTEHNLPEMGM